MTTSHLASAVLMFSVTALAACAASAGSAPATPDGDLIRAPDGRALSADELAAEAASVDAVLIGEMHDHPRGLAYAADLFGAILEREPGAALSMEFLERDAQPVVDDYLAGRIERSTFVERTKQRSPEYDRGHGRMIDAAKRAGAPVVAANAPRAFAKRARLEGYDVLRALPEEEQRLFVVPDTLPSGHYREAFASLMGTKEHGEGSSKVEAFFRAQALWDATMADSVARSVGQGRRPVVHVAGRFHVEADGGLTQLLRRQLGIAGRPDAKLLTIVMVERAEDIAAGGSDHAVVVGAIPRR